MRNLWAPWRSNYLTKPTQKKCVFCGIIRQNQDAKNFVVARSHFSIIVLNTYPYNNGHCMVVPIRHCATLDKLSRDMLADMFSMLVKIKACINTILKPNGFNIGINEGRYAGAGIANHIHLHCVPRWAGDTNFMPAIAQTKIISQSLEALYAMIKKTGDFA